jgi:uncharacterized protein (TIGR02597 family)
MKSIRFVGICFKSLLVTAGLLIIPAESLLAQSFGKTDPVGRIKLSVVGATDGASYAYSFRALSLTRAIQYQGSAETIGATTITDSQATWTTDQFNGPNGAHYIEITSGSATGLTYDIQATNPETQTLTLNQNLPAGLTVPIKFKIRKHWTIGSVFGPANESGLGGGNVTTADQVLIFNGVGYDTYYYQTSGIGGVGWRKAGDAVTDAAGSVLYPEDGLLIKRKHAGDVKVPLLGVVKSGQTTIPILAGTNLVGNVYAAPLTLADSGLYTGDPATGMAGGNVTTADQLLLWNGIGYDTYFYQTSGIGGTGWRKAGDAVSNASAAVIPVGTSMILKRKAATGFNWVIPQHPSSL